MKKHSHLCSEWNYARYEKASTLLEFYSSLITGSHNKIKAYYEKRFGENVFEGRWEACYKHCSRNVFVLCEFIGSRKGDVVVVNVNTGKRVKPARSLKPVTFAWSIPRLQPISGCQGHMNGVNIHGTGGRQEEQRKPAALRKQNLLSLRQSRLLRGI